MGESVCVCVCAEAQMNLLFLCWARNLSHLRYFQFAQFNPCLCLLGIWYPNNLLHNPIIAEDLFYVIVWTIIQEGNGNTLQYSCLANYMNRGAWHTTVHGVPNFQTWLSTHTCQTIILGAWTWSSQLFSSFVFMNLHFHLPLLLWNSWNKLNWPETPHKTYTFLDLHIQNPTFQIISWPVILHVLTEYDEFFWNLVSIFWPS